MVTHEMEIVEPVDLCVADGSSLNPAARGWSRYPLHRANLLGSWGENKRWDYWAILAGDLVISAVYSNIDHFGLADVWWVDLTTGTTGGTAILAPSDAMELPARPGTAPLVVSHDGLDLEMLDDEEGTHLRATWTEEDGRLGLLDVVVGLPKDHESLNVVIPWSDTVFNFTSKHQARPATGRLVVGERAWTIGDPSSGDAWGVLDVGRGRWPHEIAWNWGGGAGRVGEHIVGLQFGGKWTKGSGFTENGIIVDGRLSKIGRELEWSYSWERPMDPWRVVDPGGQLEIEMHPRYDKHSQADAGEFGSETHQVFGLWTGRLVTDEGLKLELRGLQGFAEEARQRW